MYERGKARLIGNGIDTDVYRHRGTVEISESYRPGTPGEYS